jgi:hypothetical protein
MAGDKSTLQSILENVRDAAVTFGRRFSPAANIRPELIKLLAELGINDPAHSVSDALAAAAAGWKSIADSLSAISLDFTDPAAIVAGLKSRGQQIEDGLNKILHAPDTALDGLGASGAAIKAVFPKRLLDYIAYEFVTKSHEKIGGAFLLLGILRRELTLAGGNTAFVDAEIRVLDFEQFIHMLTHPREAFLTVMRWGSNDFLARPVVDGMVLLLGTLPGTTRGVEDDTWSLADEGAFVAVDATKPSARRTIIVPGGTLSFVGLHKHGVGLQVPNPVNFSGNILPSLPASQLFALIPGPIPATDDPAVVIKP